METKFSKFLTGFLKNHNIQYAVLRMIENWKTQLNKRNKIGVIIMNLPKAFDILNHNLLVAKLKAYGLNLNAASFIKSYLTNRYQRCKIGNLFSEWERNIITENLTESQFFKDLQMISRKFSTLINVNLWY